MVNNRLPYLIIIMFLFFGCGMRVNIMGIDTEVINERHWGKALSGALVSVAVHEAAHYFVATAKGRDINFQGTTFEYNNQDDLIDRSGFLAQTLAGLALNYLPVTRDSDFTLGWNTMATIQLYTYPLRYENDGDFSDTGQNEWAMFTTLSTFNTYSTIDNIYESNLRSQKRHPKAYNR